MNAKPKSERAPVRNSLTRHVSPSIIENADKVGWVVSWGLKTGGRNKSHSFKQTREKCLEWCESENEKCPSFHHEPKFIG